MITSGQGWPAFPPPNRMDYRHSSFTVRGVSVIKFCRTCQCDTVRLSSGDCRECNKMRCRARYNERSKLEEEREKRRKYYLANAEAICEKVAIWKKENPDRKAALNKKWASDNKEKDKASKLKYAKKIWLTDRLRMREMARVQQSKRRARKRNAGGTYTIADIKQLFQLQRGKCACCRKNLNKYHVDHRMPLAKGGSNNRGNLELLCPSCNHSKSAKHPVDFMQSRGFLL